MSGQVDWSDVDSINAVGMGALHNRMGIRLTEAGPDRVVGTMPVEGNTQPYGIVTGVATPISVGRSMGSYEIVITDDRGRRTCTCRLTCSLRDAPPVQRG